VLVALSFIVKIESLKVLKFWITHINKYEYIMILC
jgi:hypothetical protein